MSAEVHLFVLWDRARFCEQTLLTKLGSCFEILLAVECKWTKDRFAQNLSRFYGQNLPSGSFKERECGTGPFLLVLIKDAQPAYKMIDTISRGIELVNVRTFTMKQELRQLTGGGHKVHGTNDLSEVRHDIYMLLGEKIEQIADWIGDYTNHRSIERDLIGADGWANYSEFFDALNYLGNYVVLRNFDQLLCPEEDNLHDDIDFLVSDRTDFLRIANGIATSKKSFRSQYSINISGKRQYVDVRFVGDHYYCESFEKDILTSKVFDTSLWRPQDDLHDLALLYHAIIHKPRIADDYAMTLLQKFGSTSRRDLQALLEQELADKGYKITEPKDLTVYYSSLHPSLRRRVFYFIIKIKSWLVLLLKSKSLR